MVNVRSKTREFIELVGLIGIVFLVRTLLFGLYQVPSGSMETTMLVGERFFADKFTYAFIRAPQTGDIIAFNEPTYKYSENRIKRMMEYYVWGPSNWTKRIIASPGDHIEGKVEDGKPVVYRNGVKIVEPYLNKYPLIQVWKQDPTALLQKMQNMARHGIYSKELEKEIGQLVGTYSYDPGIPFDKQAFYRINPKLIMHNEPIEQTKAQYIEGVQPHNNRFWNGTDVFDVKLEENEYWCMGDNRRGSLDSRFFGPFHREKNYIHGRIVFRIWSLDSDAWLFLVDLVKNPIDFFKRVRWNRCLQVIS